MELNLRGEERSCRGGFLFALLISDCLLCYLYLRFLSVTTRLEEDDEVDRAEQDNRATDEEEESTHDNRSLVCVGRLFRPYVLSMAYIRRACKLKARTFFNKDGHFKMGQTGAQTA
jgi:hypothetical protein